MRDNRPRNLTDRIRGYLAAPADEQEAILRETDDGDVAAELLIAKALRALYGYWPMADRFVVAITRSDDPHTAPQMELLGVIDPDGAYEDVTVTGGHDEQSIDLAQWLLNAALRRAQPAYLHAHPVGDRIVEDTFEVFIADTAYGPLWGR